MTRNLWTLAATIIIASSCSAPSQPSSTRTESPVLRSTTSSLASGEASCCCPSPSPPADAGVVAPAPPDAAVVPTPVPTPTPGARPRIYLGAHRARLQAALVAKTPAATRWKTQADRWLAGTSIWGWQAWHGALVTQLDGDVRYCAKAVALVEAQVKAAEVAAAAAKAPAVAGDSYLEVGDLIGDVAIVYDWCHAQTTDAQRKRWVAYANQAVWNVWNHKQASWGGKSMPWTGWSVDNPSNNYHYSFLRATMLLGLATKGENDQADAWLAMFSSKMATLAATFERDLQGGGSREGTGYGVAMRRLFELYSWWHASTGERLHDRTRHTRASLVTAMHQMMPTLDRIAPVGDHSRDSTAALFDYHRHYMLELIGLYPGDAQSARANAMLAASSVKQMSNSFMLVYDFLHDGVGSTQAFDSLPLVRRAAGIGGLYARSSWSKDATWIGLQAGPYTESHAHQDQGSLLVYDGGWLAADAVLWSKSGLPQDTRAHSLVRIDVGGTPQRQVASTTSSLVALRLGDGWIHAAADVTPAYAGSANVQLVQREVVFLHDGVVVVHDRVRTPAAARQVWQLILPTAPTIAGSVATVGRLQVHAAAGSTLAARALTADGADFTAGYRLELAREGGDARYTTVLAIDGAATGIVVGASAASFKLRDGRAVRVNFTPAAVGGSVSIGSVTTTLTTGVSAVPEA